MNKHIFGEGVFKFMTSGNQFGLRGYSHEKLTTFAILRQIIRVKNDWLAKTKAETWPGRG
jgi:hypothetical protein